LRNGLENLFGNIVLFVPLGFLAVLALRRSLVLIVGLGAALSLVHRIRAVRAG
jgi:glycopeptide antibiotics resistance protein